MDDTLNSTLYSFVAIFFVVLIITGSLLGTFLVALCVILVDFFLLAEIHYGGMEMNSLAVINVVIAIGLAVDYTAHIGHTYLVIKAPRRLKKKSEIRMYKARKALSQMGSSVFHGAASTFLAISCLATSRNYFFKMFYKLWMGIIIFGCSNGFLLLPVILSYIGPTGQA
jgi:Niemann-Pick C1 protein